MWQRPPAESTVAVQFSLLARATVPIIERYYLAISLLLKAGSGRLSQEALERQCQVTAERMSLLYELHSPEFFERALFGNFLDLLRSRGVLQRGADDRLTYDPAVLEAIAADAQLVLHEQIRNNPAGRTPLSRLAAAGVCVVGAARASLTARVAIRDRRKGLRWTLIPTSASQ